MSRLIPEESEIIENIYRRYYAKLFRVAAAAFYNNPALAEDVVSQAFLIACQHPQKLIKHPNPEAWITNVLHKVIVHEKRRYALFQALFVGILPLVKDDTVENRMQLDALYPGIRALPEFQIVKWLVVDGFSVTDIANRLNISVSACKKRLERARKTLAEILKEK